MKKKKNLLLVVIACLLLSCGKDDSLDTRAVVSLEDLDGKALVVLDAKGALSAYLFSWQDGQLRYRLDNAFASASGRAILETDGRISLSTEKEILLLTKDGEGKLVLDEFSNGDQAVQEVLFYTFSTLTSVAGKTFKHIAEQHYIGFDAQKVGFSSSQVPPPLTDFYQQTTDNMIWRATAFSTWTYVGITIPAGTQWQGVNGPLMLYQMGLMGSSLLFEYGKYRQMP